MRTVMFIASVLRLRDTGGDRMLPCRSTPVLG
jgi:hypothetical protein